MHVGSIPFRVLGLITVGTICSLIACTGGSGGGSTQQVAAIPPPVIVAPAAVPIGSSNLTATVIQPGGDTSYQWTITDGTITAGANTPVVTFSAGAVGTLLLACTVTNSAGSSTGQAQVLVVQETPGPQTAGYYGSRINADDLANQIVGWNTAVDSCNKAASCRLRAEHTGKLKAIRPKFIWSDAKTGYGAGNGGTIQVQIQTDDGTPNHFPSGVTLASLVYDRPITAGNHFPLLTFPNPPDLVAGQLYHIVYTNVAADPTADWVSLDHLYMWDGNNPVQPTVPNTDMALLERTCSGSWVVFSRGAGHSWTPTIELDYADGFSQGQGYIQGYGQTTTSGWVNPKPISGARGVRETFTVTGGSRTVTSVSVRVNRISGSSPLTVRVEKADGTLVGQGTVVVPQGEVSSSQNGASWVKVTFAAALTLQAGQGYHLVLSSPSDTVHTAHALEKGSSSGYKPTTYFSDGHAQFNNGSGWVGWDQWGMANRTDNDLQFYFETR